AGLVPPMLEGVALGQSEREVRSARPEAVTRRVRTPPGEFWLEERLGNGAQALFAFGDEERVLQQVQVLSRIDPRGVGPHLTAMNEQYGRPTGVWRCSAQSAAGVPTLRFTWRKSHVSVQDIFLVHPGGVSITLYVAPTETIRQSLTIGGCRPVRSREDLDDLPFATPEMLQGREVQ
ncbi:MAG TPA: hypothetical protein RMG45_17760, partial [Polyangiaceae bacterium LLY-WYZ-15_(1-7)]|nr:hypothetical protein [Polyangiaceae bacterium LLY-WYZ-15_(1-7)]